MRARYLCRNCIHDGCCADLHYCGGNAYVDRYVACAECGEEIDLQRGTHALTQDGRTLCAECAEDAE